MTSAQKETNSLKSKVSLQQEAKAIVLQVPDKSITVRIDSGVPDWVSPSIQIFVAILAAAASAGTILWQMRKQRELTLRQQKEITRAQLRLDAHSEFKKLLADLNASGLISVEIAMMFAAFQKQSEGIQENIPIAPIQYREPAFRDSLNKLTNNTIKLIYFLERHAPILPGFDVFKLALSAAVDSVNKDYMSFQTILLRWLPIDNPSFDAQTNPHPYLQCPTITAEAVREFQISMKPIIKSVGLLECWISDFAIDIQNHLLGDYADQHVAHRIPIDPDYFVVTSDAKQREELTKYFMEKTEYGRQWKAAQDWARQELLQRKNSASAD